METPYVQLTPLAIRELLPLAAWAMEQSQHHNYGLYIIIHPTLT